MASEDNEGREEVLEEAEEAGQDEKKGGDRWWIYVVVMVLGLAGVGYLALNGIGRSAHKLAAGDKYGRLAAASEEYGGEDAARRAVREGRAFTYETDDLSAEQAARDDRRLAVAWVHPRITSTGQQAKEGLAYVVRDQSTGLLAALDAFITANRASYATP